MRTWRDRLRSNRLSQAAVTGTAAVGSALTRLLPNGVWVRIRERGTRVGRLDYPRRPISLVVDSWIEQDVRLHSCAKEPSTVAWIETWFRPGDVFYDIGANVGAYALVAAAFLDGHVRVFAFEPGFTSFPQLCRNVTLNRYQAAIVPLQVALGRDTALVDFHYQNLSTGGALHALGDAIDQHGRPFSPRATIPTMTYSLDELVSQFGLPAPSHVKIDVDGTELDILRGAARTLESPGLRTLLIKLNDRDAAAAEAIAFLEARGLKLHAREAENTIFIR